MAVVRYKPGDLVWWGSPDEEMGYPLSPSPALVISVNGERSIMIEVPKAGTGEITEHTPPEHRRIHQLRSSRYGPAGRTLEIAERDAWLTKALDPDPMETIARRMRKERYERTEAKERKHTDDQLDRIEGKIDAMKGQTEETTVRVRAITEELTPRELRDYAGIGMLDMHEKRDLRMLNQHVRDLRMLDQDGDE